MTSGGPSALRPLGAADARAAHDLIERALPPEYHELPLHHLRLALSAEPGDESRGSAAIDGEQLAGFVLYGLVAGAIGTGRIHLVAVDERHRRGGIGRRLVAATLDALFAIGARFVVAELPDDPALAAGRLLLTSEGFREEARVDDFVRDGVALLIVRTDGRGGSAAAG